MLIDNNAALTHEKRTLTSVITTHLRFVGRKFDSS